MTLLKRKTKTSTKDNIAVETAGGIHVPAASVSAVITMSLAPTWKPTIAAVTIYTSNMIKQPDLGCSLSFSTCYYPQIC